MFDKKCPKCRNILPIGFDAKVTCPFCNTVCDGSQPGPIGIRGATKRPQDWRPTIVESKKEALVTCPKCGSTQIGADKKGFGLGKAVVGGVLVGGVGLLAGFFGSRKVQVTCLACGNQWTAGKAG